jgi:coniferyl-aldehyde dehydrogenase
VAPDVWQFLTGSAVEDYIGTTGLHKINASDAYYSKHLTTWMKPSKRHVSIIHQPAKAWVQYQPLGVIGIITPWNYPLLLSIGPLICALAAGNHAMIKISSASANFGRVIENALSEAFPQELVAVINGGGAVSDAFCRLAFDKMIFTGSTSVGKTVMAAASQNLVPVILELGGKSPALVHSAMNIRDVACLKIKTSCKPLRSSKPSLSFSPESQIAKRPLFEEIW